MTNITKQGTDKLKKAVEKKIELPENLEEKIKQKAELEKKIEKEVTKIGKEEVKGIVSVGKMLINGATSRRIHLSNEEKDKDKFGGLYKTIKEYYNGRVDKSSGIRFLGFNVKLLNKLNVALYGYELEVITYSALGGLMEDIAKLVRNIEIQFKNKGKEVNNNQIKDEVKKIIENWTNIKYDLVSKNKYVVDIINDINNVVKSVSSGKKVNITKQDVPTLAKIYNIKSDDVYNSIRNYGTKNDTKKDFDISTRYIVEIKKEKKPAFEKIFNKDEIKLNESLYKEHIFSRKKDENSENSGYSVAVVKLFLDLLKDLYVAVNNKGVRLITNSILDDIMRQLNKELEERDKELLSIKNALNTLLESNSVSDISLRKETDADKRKTVKKLIIKGLKHLDKLDDTVKVELDKYDKIIIKEGNTQLIFKVKYEKDNDRNNIKNIKLISGNKEYKFTLGGTYVDILEKEGEVFVDLSIDKTSISYRENKGGKIKKIELLSKNEKTLFKNTKLLNIKNTSIITIVLMIETLEKIISKMLDKTDEGKVSQVEEVKAEQVNNNEVKSPQGININDNDLNKLI